MVIFIIVIIVVFALLIDLSFKETELEMKYLSRKEFENYNKDMAKRFEAILELVDNNKKNTRVIAQSLIDRGVKDLIIKKSGGVENARD